MKRPSVLDRAFDQLEAAALKGERCPVSDSVLGGSKSVSDLAHSGRIFVEIFAHNFRRVTILEGLAKGKATADPPRDRRKEALKPYLTVGKAGTFRNGSPIDTGLKARPGPSAPRSIGN